MIGEVMQHRSEFVDRHIGPNQYQIQTMLLELGYKDLDSFIKAVVPQNIHIKGEIEKSLPVGISEVAALAEISEIAKKNKVMKSLIGTGYYGTITPAVILRNVLENPGWYTA
jgi:glycine dehydrogenase